VVPTHVGMNRFTNNATEVAEGGSHARGDEPGETFAVDYLIVWFPRTWG